MEQEPCAGAGIEKRELSRAGSHSPGRCITHRDRPETRSVQRETPHRCHPGSNLGRIPVPSCPVKPTLPVPRGSLYSTLPVPRYSPSPTLPIIKYPHIPPVSPTPHPPFPAVPPHPTLPFPTSHPQMSQNPTLPNPKDPPHPLSWLFFPYHIIPISPSFSPSSLSLPAHSQLCPSSRLTGRGWRVPAGGAALPGTQVPLVLGTIQHGTGSEGTFHLSSLGTGEWVTCRPYHQP